MKVLIMFLVTTIVGMYAYTQCFTEVYAGGVVPFALFTATPVLSFIAGLYDIF